MADNYLITGYWGEPHVTAENDRGINAATFGTGRFVLAVGKQFNAEYIGNNTIRMYDGKLMDNGAAAGIPAGEYVDLLISNAGQGKKRNDLIVFQYSRDSSTLIESGKFVVVKGTETSGTPSDPSLTQKDLLSGNASSDQMALWRVSVSGGTISTPVKMFSVVDPFAQRINRGNFSGDLDIIGDGGVKTNSVVWVSKDAKSPFPDSWGWVETWASQSNSIVQRATQINGKTWVRTYYYKNSTVGAVWGDWIRIDSIGPNMTAGTEYLTPEFWDSGKPVYKKLVKMGKLTTEFVTVAHGASLYYVVGVEAMAINESTKMSFPIAYGANDNVDTIGVYVDTTNVTIHNPEMLSSYSGYVIIKYVK